MTSRPALLFNQPLQIGRVVQRTEAGKIHRAEMAHERRRELRPAVDFQSLAPFFRHNQRHGLEVASPPLPVQLDQALRRHQPALPVIRRSPRRRREVARVAHQRQDGPRAAGATQLHLRAECLEAAHGQAGFFVSWRRGEVQVERA